MELLSQDSKIETSLFSELSKLIETALKIAEGIVEAVEKKPTLVCYICRKIWQAKCRNAFDKAATPSRVDDNELPDFVGALLSWLVTVSSDDWPEPSCLCFNCRCVALRRSAKTVTPSPKLTPSLIPTVSKCSVCRSAQHVYPDVTDPRRSLCMSCYERLDARVGIPYPSEVKANA